jgi:hypothetical protein
VTWWGCCVNLENSSLSVGFRWYRSKAVSIRKFYVDVYEHLRKENKVVLSGQATLKCLLGIKNRKMDNVQNYDSYINIPSSQAYR